MTILAGECLYCDIFEAVVTHHHLEHESPFRLAHTLCLEHRIGGMGLRLGESVDFVTQAVEDVANTIFGVVWPLPCEILFVAGR